jgi:hypothetical protein
MMMVGAVIGHGACSFPIAIDVDSATSSQHVIIPSTDSIWNCMIIAEL